MLYLDQFTIQISEVRVMVTIKDVAREAGVSTATVSNALSGSKPVSPKTKKKIMDAVAKLHYLPNISARNLKAAKSKTVGVVLPNTMTRFYSLLFAEISTYLQQHGYSIQAAFTEDIPEAECAQTDSLIMQNVDGLLILTCQPDNTDFFKKHILDRHIPVCFLERAPRNLSVNFVSYDHYQSVYSLCSILLEKKYTRFAILCGTDKFSSESDCISGMQDALAASEKETSYDIYITDSTSEDAFACFMRKISRNLPEILITTSKELAEGVRIASDTLGISLVDHFLMISFCEESWEHSVRTKRVFYTSRPTSALGCTAGRILLRNIEDDSLYDTSFPEIEDTGIEPLRDQIPANRLCPVTQPPFRISQHLRILAFDAPSVRAMQILTESFERESSISVEYTIVPQNDLLARISDPENHCDLFTWDTPWLEYLVQNQCLSDLTDFVQSSGLFGHKFFPSNLKSCHLDSSYYGIPCIGGTQLLFYRKDCFENPELRKKYAENINFSLRPPRTWKEFNGIARFFTGKYNPGSPTEFGTSVAGIINEELAPELLTRLWAFGGSLWDRYHRPSLSTSAVSETFQSTLTTLNYVPCDPFRTSITDTVHDFCGGRTAMLITYSEYAQQIRDHLSENGRGDFGCSYIPGMHPANVGWNFGLNPLAKNPESAKQFLRWISRKDTSYFLTILNGSSPIMAPYHDYRLRRRYPWMTLMESSTASSVSRNSPYSTTNLIIPPNRVEDILCAAFHRTASGDQNISDSLAQAQAEAEALFQSYGYTVSRRYH